MRLLPSSAIVLALTACGQARPTGDAGGVPLTVQVVLVRTYANELAHVQTSTTVVGPSWGPADGPSRSDPYFERNGLGDAGWSRRYDEPRLQPWLLAGDGPREGRLFRVALDWGQTDFTVPVRAGRTVVLTLQTHGDRDAWEEVGRFTMPDHPATLVVDCGEHPARVGVR